MMTAGQRSPKVLMISAVCGRSPPRAAPPKPSAVPPPPPPSSHNLLSVTYTRGFSAAALQTTEANTIPATNVSLIFHLSPSRVRLGKVVFPERVGNKAVREGCLVRYEIGVRVGPKRNKEGRPFQSSMSRRRLDTVATKTWLATM